MPLKSKAQARLFFAKDPEKAKKMVKETPGGIGSLPEKKHPSVNPKGRKLKNVKLAGEGRFFRDQPGRDDGLFFKAAFTSYAPGQIPQGGGINVGAVGAPMSGMGMGGDGMGSSYGTGTGKKKPATKTAAAAPSDIDLDGDGGGELPVGMHRPTETQPEPLEAGGTRFHASDVDCAPSFGTGKGLGRGGGNDQRTQLPVTAGHQMGKHAMPRRFLGTSAALSKEAAPEGYWGQRASEFGGSLREGGRQAASYADQGVQAITRSPLAAGIAAVALGKLGLRGLKGGGRLAGKGIGRIRRGPPPPPAPAAKQVGTLAQRLRNFITD